MRKLQVVDQFYFKIIAMVTMLIDHVGAYLVSPSNPAYIPLRIIGRIAMPLYAFFVVEGMRYTRNRIRYLLQLLIMGVIVNVFTLIFLHDYVGSIFDTFFIAGLFIYLIEHENTYLKPLALIPLIIGFLSSFSFFPIRLEYGFYGVVTVLIFYLGFVITDRISKNYCLKLSINYDEYKSSKDFTFYYVLFSFLLLIAFNLLCTVFSNVLYLYMDASNVDYIIQNYSIISGALLLFYNGKRGYNKPWFKYGCYVFYPLHLVIIYIIGLSIR